MKRVILALLMSAMMLLAEGLTLKSPDLGGQLSKAQEYDGFGCNGENLSPALIWSDAPKGTMPTLNK